MHAGQPRPFRLEDARTEPNILRLGQPFRILVEAVNQGAASGAQGPPVFAEYDGRRVALARAGSETAGRQQYVAELEIAANAPVGFGGIPLILEVGDDPLKRASARASYMVIPSEALAVYGEGPESGWDIGHADGFSDPHSTKRAHSGSLAHELNGGVTYQLADREVNRFGYALEFYAWSDAGTDAQLRVDDFSLDEAEIELQPGVWTQVVIPAERLYNRPPVFSDALTGRSYLEPALRRIRFHAEQTVYLDDVQLRPLVPGEAGLPGMDTAIGAPDHDVSPWAFSLQQNYPNPFNAQTTIAYEVPRSGPVSLVLYDLLGQRVTSLVDQWQPAGAYRVSWDGADTKGAPVSSGVYLFRLEAGDRAATRCLVLVR